MLAANYRTPNPHYPGSSARMSDGRLFTDYSNTNKAIGPASWETKQSLQKTGEQRIRAERSLLTMMGATVSAVGMSDTMVPEQTKRICNWEGCSVLPAHPVGIGQGRLYFPGRSELASADPDYSALETAKTVMYGAYPVSFGTNTGMVPPIERIAVPSQYNRYSFPYGA